MICNLFVRMRTHGEYMDNPACGVVVLSKPLLEILAKLDACAKAVRAADGFSVSFLCGFTVYDDAAIPDSGIWERIVAKLENREALIVWTNEPILWDERAVDTCLAISYGHDDVVFQCQGEYDSGSTESDPLALSDIQDYWKEQHVPGK